MSNSNSRASEERLDSLEETVSLLSNAVNGLVTDFLRPLTQQSIENQRSIAALIESEQRHQEWLDEDRQDLAAYRREQQAQSQQIQALIEASREDRRQANEKFDAMQLEIRQNQRLLLSGQERLDAAFAEMLSLSRRVANIEDVA